MECVMVCAAGAGALADAAAVALAAVVALAALALIAAVVSVVLGYAWVLTVAVLAVCVPALWLFARVLKHGPTVEVFRRHRRVPRTRRAASWPQAGSAPAGTSLMLEAAPPKVYVITDARERVAR